MKKVVYTLSDEESIEIQTLFEKKLALENLFKIIDSSKSELLDKLTTDYGKVLREFREWWDFNSKKYNWEGDKWYVDFRTNEVIYDNM